MNIDELLKERKMKKAQLAEKLGVKKQNVNGLLKNPTEATIRRLGEAMGVDAWELLAPAETRHKLQSGSATLTCPKCGAPIKVTLSEDAEQ